MLLEQPAKLALTDADPAGQRIDGSLVERAHFHQRERARDGVGGAAPGAKVGRGFRPATQAGPEPGFVCGGRGREENHILRSRCAGRADRPAVDAGGLDAGEQPAVEAGIADGDARGSRRRGRDRGCPSGLCRHTSGNQVLRFRLGHVASS